MKRRSKVAGRAGKAGRHKEATPKGRRNPPGAVPGRRLATTGRDTETARLVRERDEALEQQTATADILRVISRSPSDLQPVFDTIAVNAARLCNALWSAVIRYDSELMHLVSFHNLGDPRRADALRQTFPRPLSSDAATERAILTRTVVHIPDVLNEPGYAYGELALATGYRSAVSVPLLQKGRPVGAISVVGASPGIFSERQIELLHTFANQAAIAIENVRLFEAEQERTRELAKSLEDLRAAQDRLVQTQKLASLGQLTAGIAHEIKNPLNFVNNFSGVSVELIDELQETLGRATAEKKRVKRSPTWRLPCATTSTRSCSTVSAPTPSSRICCCIRGKVRSSIDPLTSTPWSRRASIWPTMVPEPKSRASLSLWNVPLIQPPVRPMFSRKTLRGYC
jgi:hypothetical protein